MATELIDDISKQIVELLDAYCGLEYVGIKDEIVTVSGVLSFEAFYEGLEPISESFDVELGISLDFPTVLPEVKEVGGQIDSKYEHVFTNGTLCLGIPIEQRRIMYDNPTILRFVDKLVVPYLYGYCYSVKYGSHPFGEAAHGSQGIADYYISSFNLRNCVEALSVVCFLYEFGYRENDQCPCGSDLRVSECHKTDLLSFYEIHTVDTLSNDFKAILDVCIYRSVEEKIALKSFLPTSLYNRVLFLTTEGVIRNLQ